MKRLQVGVCLLLSMLCISIISGCEGDTSKETNQNDWNNISTTDGTGAQVDSAASDHKLSQAERNNLTACTQTIWNELATGDKNYSLETQTELLGELEMAGYTAVDIGNQINMVNAQALSEFCEKVDQNVNGQVGVVVLLKNASLSYYVFQSEAGKVNVCRHSLSWNGSELQEDSTAQFDAYYWNYTGTYLLFEEYHMQGYDGASGHVGFRVEPLDDQCRELNRKYINAIGCVNHNMWITDWSEDNYTNLNLVDLYEILSRLKQGKTVSTADYEEGITYRLPADDLESLYQTYFQIDKEELRKRLDYDAASGMYLYHTRTTYDHGSTSTYPYTEVTGYEDNGDGTITLDVKAIWPDQNSDDVVTCKVVVRTFADGSFQYVSNHVETIDQSLAEIWYEDRMSSQEWSRYYEE